MRNRRCLQHAGARVDRLDPEERAEVGAKTIGGGDMHWASISFLDHEVGCVVWGETQAQADRRARAIVRALNAKKGKR